MVVYLIFPIQSTIQRISSVVFKLGIWWHVKVLARRLGNVISMGNLEDWVMQRLPNLIKTPRVIKSNWAEAQSYSSIIPPRNSKDNAFQEAEIWHVQCPKWSHSHRKSFYVIVHPQEATKKMTPCPSYRNASIPAYPIPILYIRIVAHTGELVENRHRFRDGVVRIIFISF